MNDDNIIHQFDGGNVRAAWKSACLAGPKGGLMPNLHNALVAVRCDPELKDCYGYDEMDRAIVVLHEIGSAEPTYRRVRDGDYVDLAEWLQANGDMANIGLDIVRAVLDRCAHERAFHPIIGYLNALQWD